tara:strand:+ start:189 stop:503 length:315 start_codon:yes stop_codon:yes gene_type:complete
MVASELPIAREFCMTPRALRDPAPPKTLTALTKANVKRARTNVAANETQKFTRELILFIPYSSATQVTKQLGLKGTVAISSFGIRFFRIICKVIIGRFNKNLHI